jgi:hypothetical protein
VFSPCVVMNFLLWRRGEQTSSLLSKSRRFASNSQLRSTIGRNCLIQTSELIRLIRQLKLTTPLTHHTKSHLLNLFIKVDRNERPTSVNVIRLFDSLSSVIQSNPTSELIDLLSLYILRAKDPIKGQDIKNILDSILPPSSAASAYSNELSSSSPSPLSLSSVLAKHILRRLEKLYLPFTCGSSTAGDVLDVESYCHLVLRLKPFIHQPEVNSLFHSLNRLVCLDFFCYKKTAALASSSSVHTNLNQHSPQLCLCGNPNLFLAATEGDEATTGARVGAKVEMKLNSHLLTETVIFLNSFESQNKKVQSILRKLSILLTQPTPVNNSTAETQLPLPTTFSSQSPSLDKVISDLRAHFTFPILRVDTQDDLDRYPTLIETASGDFTPSLLCQALGVLRYLPLSSSITADTENTALVRKMLKVCYYKYSQQQSYFLHHQTTTLPNQLLSLDSLHQSTSSSPPLFTCEEVAHGILGLKHLECDHHLIHHFIAIFTDYLITLFQSHHTLSCQQCVMVCQGIQSMEGKRMEISNLLLVLSEHIMRRNQIPSDDLFTPADISLMLFSLRNMSSNSNPFRRVLSFFSQLIVEMKPSEGGEPAGVFFDDRQLALALQGLQHSECHFPEVQAVLTQLTNKFQNHSPSTPYDRDSLFLLFQYLTPFQSSTPAVRSLIDTLRIKLETHSINSNLTSISLSSTLSPSLPLSKNIWICIRSLSSMSSDHQEVRQLLTYLSQELSISPPLPLSSYSQSEEINLIQFLSFFHSLDSKYIEVRTFLESLVSSLSLQKGLSSSQIGRHQLSLAVYGLQRLHGPFPIYDEIISILHPLLLSTYGTKPHLLLKKKQGDLGEVSRLELTHQEMNSYSKIVYGMIAQQSSHTDTPYHYQGKALQIVETLIKFLEIVQLPNESRKRSEIVTRSKLPKELVSDIGECVNSYASLIRSLQLFSFYAKQSQHPPTELLKTLDDLTSKYLRIFEEHHWIYLYLLEQQREKVQRGGSSSSSSSRSSKPPPLYLPGQIDLISEMEFELSEELTKVIQLSYPQAHVVTGRYLDGFQTDILLKISLTPKQAKDLHIMNSSPNHHLLQSDVFSPLQPTHHHHPPLPPAPAAAAPNILFINFEIDGPSHQILNKDKFCERRDEYLKEKYTLHIHRIHLVDYGLLEMKVKKQQFLYSAIAKIEWKKYLKQFKTI